MASNINPSNIDGTYPVAGQDNDSQGFRDNFTNARNNFSYAKAEIEDLQNKAILKEPLSGEIIDDSFNNLTRSYQIHGAIFRDNIELIADLGTTSGTATINFQTAHYQTVILNNPLTLAFSNFENGKNCRVVLEVGITDVTQTLTLPSLTFNGSTNLKDYDPSTYTFTFSATGTYRYQFESRDGGTSFFIRDLSRNKVDIYSANNAVDTNVTAFTVDFTAAGIERTVVSANANVTVSYSDSAVAGKESKLFIQNLNGSNVTITLPDANNNFASATFDISTTAISTITFTAMDNSNSNVFCTVVTG